MNDFVGNMTNKNLLICFDAFGTLFTPKRPIMQQYAEVARGLGLKGFTNEQVGTAFVKAYKEESKTHPNYGHYTGLGAEKWWSNIIVNTFTQVLPGNHELPRELVPKLLHRFWSDEGYMLYPDVLSVLQRLRKHARGNDQHVILGVITNSDDRVPDILTSLGLRVAPLRHGQAATIQDQAADIDFVVMSYDVGHEKPDRRIFDAAVESADVLAQRHKHSSGLASWTKVYVGDEYAKDVIGSLAAGWNAVLIDREGPQEHPDVIWPTKGEATLFELFEQSRAVGFNSLQNLAETLR